MNANNEQIAKQLAKQISNLDVSKLVVYDLNAKQNYTQYMFVCSAKDEQTVLETATKIEQYAQELNLELLKKEGITKPNWLVLDFYDMVVHIFCENEREKYKFDWLYKGCKTLDF
jgi:ribosome-associated protein